MKAAFWRFAHRRYHLNKPSRKTTVLLFQWFALFAMGYGIGVLSGWVPNFAEAITAIFLLGVPLTLGMLHRRIRIEAAKGPDALYRKRLKANR